jgi:hypothetical protein
MELQRYKEQIRNELLSGVKKSIKKDNMLAGGELRSERRPMPRKKVMDSPGLCQRCLRRLDKQSVPIQNMGGDISDESDSDEEEGGKIHFMKSFKKLGDTVKHTGSEIAETAKKAGLNAVAKEVANQATSAVKTVAKNAMTYAPEIELGAEESAPLLLAAGLKRPRKRREISQKEKSRHALIRSLMNKHGISLAEASKHIKQNNLKY